MAAAAAQTPFKWPHEMPELIDQTDTLESHVTINTALWADHTERHDIHTLIYSYSAHFSLANVLSDAAAQSSDNAWSKACNRKSASAMLKHMGGLMRNTLPYKPPLPMSTPSCLSRSMTCSSMNSMSSASTW